MILYYFAELAARPISIIVTCFLLGTFTSRWRKCSVVTSTVGFTTKDDQNHTFILRMYVSKKTSGNKQALLSALGLTSADIAQFTIANPYNEPDAIQAGLEAWVGRKDPTWNDLLKKMREIEIATQICNALEAKLHQ